MPHTTLACTSPKGIIIVFNKYRIADPSALWCLPLSTLAFLLWVVVFPYGSVPLKTYLPDGDIDLTALSCQNIEDGLVSDVHAVLRGEENNEAAEYEVKDVRFIDAEVKLVKCLVQNIVVDISFNQLGGLSTLCFLEKVDRLVAKDHIFKRSIILIKAWCYYESRILGAHHGLISTYALETLVLYIFHRFHMSLDGPLAVLYRFLDYFSKFDWDNYCVSLKGPVGKSSPPDVVADALENGGNTLLTDEFIRSCVESFSVPPRGIDLNLRAFPHKHLNIIDPLKENNNLGRSVNKGTGSDWNEKIEVTGFVLDWIHAHSWSDWSGFYYIASNNILRGIAYDNDVMYIIQNVETATILMKNEKRGMALTLDKPKIDQGHKPVLPGF
ncbi:poly(A) RNA poly(A)merase cid14 [Trifolium pratense]|uniref:Poly(A) RNA poly(A)merase cid14 n=1 Tax=Trifolium pratense TaxID=57577 RepID=A0A2K3NY16_TRIPR|nr:poly(A) RNA poly(A)merase cid14 [Trifolium pratense]